MKKKITIILDCAHGEQTQGKRSPDESYKEYQGSRITGTLLKDKLMTLGYIVYETAPGETEPGLVARTNLANKVHKAVKDTLLISLHNNAASTKKEWTTAHGFEIYTSPGQTKSDFCATIIFEALQKEFPTIRARADYSDGDPDKEAGFWMLTKTKGLAVLIEWLFMDNKTEVEMLKSPTIVFKYVDTLVGAIEHINRNWE